MNEQANARINKYILAGILPEDEVMVVNWEIEAIYLERDGDIIGLMTFPNDEMAAVFELIFHLFPEPLRYAHAEAAIRACSGLVVPLAQYVRLLVKCDHLLWSHFGLRLMPVYGQGHVLQQEEEMEVMA